MIPRVLSRAARFDRGCLRCCSPRAPRRRTPHRCCAAPRSGSRSLPHVLRGQAVADDRRRSGDGRTPARAARRRLGERDRGRWRGAHRRAPGRRTYPRADAAAHGRHLPDRLPRRSTGGGAFRCPIWLPTTPADGRSRAVRLIATLPSGASPSGTMPSFAWVDGTGTGHARPPAGVRAAALRRRRHHRAVERRPADGCRNGEHPRCSASLLWLRRSAGRSNRGSAAPRSQAGAR